MSPVLEPIPLELDADQVFRIGGTRVPLETVLDAFNSGATPEEIAQDFPVLRLDDVYAVITLYLRHREEIDAYLSRREALAETVRQRVESRFPASDLRQRLLARMHP